MSKRRHGLVLVITGPGKGKTTSALGLAWRALGNGFKVFMVQYIKGKWKTGEKKMADKLAPDLEIRPMGDGFTWDTKNPEQDIATTLKIWEVSREAISTAITRTRTWSNVPSGKGSPLTSNSIPNQLLAW